jgi:hypothetical protein
MSSCNPWDLDAHLIKMDTSPAMPEAPAPEMTRPRMTCHMVWPMPLCVVNIKLLLRDKTKGDSHNGATGSCQLMVQCSGG